MKPRKISNSTLYCGDTLEVLKTLPSESISMCVTSPPYWALRSYLPKDHPNKKLEMGSEESPDKYIAAMVKVFREVKRVLRKDGTLWVNVGDTYGDSGNGGNRNGLSKSTLKGGKEYGRGCDEERKPRSQSLPPGNLVGIPWKLAFALQADGWILRQDIIWHKPSVMPESVTNRCTKAHEYIFLFAKAKGYYYDAVAITEKAEPAIRVTRKKSGSLGQAIASGRKPSGNGKPGSVMVTGNTRNKRSVWTVTSANSKEAHFATFPQKLIRPCILAGTSQKGVCPQCGSPWRRVVEKQKLTRSRPNRFTKRTGEEGTGNVCDNTVAGVDVVTKGWKPTCDCPKHKPVPATILDPFSGTATTGVVCEKTGRKYVGIDLNEEYIEISMKRLKKAAQNKGMGLS